jgi:hypothetical protein
LDEGFGKASATFPPELFGTLPYARRTIASLRSEDAGVMNSKANNMNNPSKARGMFTDFAASLLMALSIGVATSVTLAGAVVLIAHQSTQSEGTP